MAKLPEPIVGRRIVAIRAMTPAELDAEGWPNEAKVPALVLDDGTALYPSCDYEGNGPGALFGSSGKEGFFVSLPR
ncbi:MAG: hypothetical protein AB7N54_00020 [Alphaproteobacteria bacterium]